jgi:hypothetical protein
MIRKYRKRPVVVDVVLYDGKNKAEIDAFVGRDLVRNPDGSLIIPTLEGQHIASVGDFIIRGVHGENYPCKPDIFEKTYEPA